VPRNRLFISTRFTPFVPASIGKAEVAMEEILHRASEIAVEAARFAGTLIRERFGGSFRVREKGDFGDLVTEVDEQAEQEIIRRIRRHFPDHAIRGEE
jgi:myo-inositol-1(or 4)-monophosphatase